MFVWVRHFMKLHSDFPLWHNPSFPIPVMLF
jgi:hypothetical protein